MGRDLEGSLGAGGGFVAAGGGEREGDSCGYCSGGGGAAEGSEQLGSWPEERSEIHDVWCVVLRLCVCGAGGCHQWRFELTGEARDFWEFEIEDNLWGDWIDQTEAGIGGCEAAPWYQISTDRLFVLCDFGYLSERFLQRTMYGYVSGA